MSTTITTLTALEEYIRTMESRVQKLEKENTLLKKQVRMILDHVSKDMPGGGPIY